MAPPVRHKDRWIVRASLAGLFVVLCFLAAFSIVTERGVARKSALADRATRLSATYQDVRHWRLQALARANPEGLIGDRIPLESRVILVADAFEAMTSDRPYRLAPGQSFALRELGRHAGTQFDPTVVEALTRVLARAGDATGAADRARSAA